MKCSVEPTTDSLGCKLLRKHKFSYIHTYILMKGLTGLIRTSPSTSSDGGEDLLVPWWDAENVTGMGGSVREEDVSVPTNWDSLYTQATYVQSLHRLSAAVSY